MADSIQFEYAIYMLSTHAKNLSVVLQELLAKKYASLKLVAEMSKMEEKEASSPASRKQTALQAGTTDCIPD